MGAIIAIVAFGFSIVYSFLRFPNFAHGEYCAVGGYLSYYVHNSLDIHVFYSIALSSLLTGSLGVLLYEIVLKKVERISRGSLLLASLGLAIMLQAILMLIFRSRPLYIPYNRNLISVFKYNLFSHEVAALIIIAVLFLTIALFQRRSIMGYALKALPYRKDLLLIAGLPVRKLTILAVFMSALTAGIAGGVIALDSGLVPQMGFQYLLLAFVSALIGGFDNIIGTLLGAIIVGMAWTIAMAFMSSLMSLAAVLTVATVLASIYPDGILSIKRRIK